MSKIVLLKGGYDVPSAGEPDTEIVEHLEDLLRQAKEGSIDGLVVFRSHPDGMVSSSHRGLASSYMMIGIIEVEKQIIMKALED